MGGALLQIDSREKAHAFKERACVSANESGRPPRAASVVVVVRPQHRPLYSGVTAAKIFVLVSAVSERLLCKVRVCQKVLCPQVVEEQQQIQ